MFNEDLVAQWLDGFVDELRKIFGERLVFVAHHGSWARGEGRPDSDIDAVVILDQIGECDLSVYRDLIYELSNGQSWVSTFFGSMTEVPTWPRYEHIQWWYGAKILHGDLANLGEAPLSKDFLDDVRIKATSNLHVARHYLLHPHDSKMVVHRLYYPFKECFYTMQSWMLLTTKTYYACKIDLLANLSDPDDKEVIRIAQDWHELGEDRNERPLYYIQLLERWTRSMLLRVRDWTEKQINDPNVI